MRPLRLCFSILICILAFTAVVRAEGNAAIQIVQKKLPEIQKLNIDLQKISLDSKQTSVVHVHVNNDVAQASVYENYADFQRDNVLQKLDYKTLIFCTAQTAITSYVFLFTTPEITNTGLVAAISAGFLNFYYGIKANRWSEYLNWGRDRIKKWTIQLGKAQFMNKPWFDSAAKSAAGFAGTLFFSAFYNGILMWESLYAAMASLDSNLIQSSSTHYLWTSFWKGLLSFVVSQPLDTVFSNWLEHGKQKYKYEQVAFAVRTKSLILAALSPLIFLEWEPAYGVAGAMSAAGMMLLVSDSKDLKIKISLRDRFEQFKSRIKYSCSSLLADHF